jgi:hypothetical protein
MNTPNDDYFYSGYDFRRPAPNVRRDTAFEDELLAEIEDLREQNIHLRATIAMVRQVLGATIDNLVIG